MHSHTLPHTLTGSRNRRLTRDSRIPDSSRGTPGFVSGLFLDFFYDFFDDEKSFFYVEGVQVKIRLKVRVGSWASVGRERERERDTQHTH